MDFSIRRSIFSLEDGPGCEGHSLRGSITISGEVVFNTGMIGYLLPMADTTGLGVPCRTLRENAERPLTVTEGTNILVGSDPGRILREGLKALDAPGTDHRISELWNGNAPQRIVAVGVVGR